MEELRRFIAGLHVQNKQANVPRCRIYNVIFDILGGFCVHEKRGCRLVRYRHQLFASIISYRTCAQSFRIRYRAGSHERSVGCISATILLCFWHIEKKVVAKFKPHFTGRDVEEWKALAKDWRSVRYLSLHAIDNVYSC